MSQSCSALLTASLQYFAAVSGLHSLTEAVNFASLTLLGLVGSQHEAGPPFLNSCFLCVIGISIPHNIILHIIGYCQGVLRN